MNAVDVATVAGAVAALGAVVVVPAAVAALGGCRRGRTDLLEALGRSYAGLAVSCWSIWVAALFGGLTRATMFAAPLVASAALVALMRATATARPAPMVPSAEDVAASRRQQAAVLLTAVINVALVAMAFVPYGLQRADGVHRMGMTDWYKHLMVATALQGRVFPPANPFLVADGQAPYYYGFHLVAVSLQRAMGAADPYFTLLALTLLTAAAFPLVLFVVARGLFGDPRRAMVAAVGGTLLAGFDLVVWLLHALRDVVAALSVAPGTLGVRAIVPSTHLDFWIHHNERQFSPPYISLIWAPQHVAAVIVALLILHLMRGATNGPRGGGSARPVASSVLPAVMLAALPALSAYVALAFACGVAGSVLVDAWRNRLAPWSTSTFVRWRTAALLAAVAALPVASGLAGGESGGLTFAVSSAGSWLNGALFSAVLGDNRVTRLLDTPALYLVELGVVGLLALSSVRARRATGTLSSGQRDALAVTAAILLLVTLVRPPVGGPNNLYARPMLLVWSLLACFAADAWCATTNGQRERIRPWRTVGVAIGLGGTLLGALGATAEGWAFWATPPDLVAAARWVNAETAAETAVGADPERLNLGYWSRRRTVVADRRHALLFGATGAEYDAALAGLRRAFGQADPVEAARQLAALGADAVVIEDPPSSWVESPCFTVGYRGSQVMVLLRSPSGCRATGGR